MKNYVLDYVNENEFHKLEKTLKKYNTFAYKKLNVDYYPDFKAGKFQGEVVSQNKKEGTTTYELKLPSDEMFAQIHGEIKLIYTVYTKEKTVMLSEITPKRILIEGHNSTLDTYKGVMISKENASKDMFKINLLNELKGFKE